PVKVPENTKAHGMAFPWAYVFIYRRWARQSLGQNRRGQENDLEAEKRRVLSSCPDLSFRPSYPSSSRLSRLAAAAIVAATGTSYSTAEQPGLARYRWARQSSTACRDTTSSGTRSCST